MRRTLFFLFTFVCVNVFSPAAIAVDYTQSKAEYLEQKVKKGHDFTKIPANAEYRPGYLLVRFASKTDGLERAMTEKTQILAALGGASIKRGFRGTPSLALVELPAGQTVADALVSYNARDDILHAQPDYLLRPLATVPDDPRYRELWGMHNRGQSGGSYGMDIDAERAWDIRSDANDIIVAVIDTGVDYNHPDLAGNMWINVNEEPNDANEDSFPGKEGFDDDADGLTDEDSEGK